MHKRTPFADSPNFARDRVKDMCACRSFHAPQLSGGINGNLLSLSQFSIYHPFTKLVKPFCLVARSNQQKE